MLAILIYKRCPILINVARRLSLASEFKNTG